MPSRVQEWLTALTLDTPLPGAHPADEALLSLLVHAALSDGDIGPGQLAQLRMVMPNATEDEVLARISDEAKHTLSFEGLLMAVPDEADRQRLERLATTMVWSNTHVDTSENDFLRQLSVALQ